MNQAILHCAALLVPREQRDAWLAEWQSELWYVSGGRDAKTTEFCLGAFRDAIWVRHNSPHPPARWRMQLASPFQCLCVLAVLAATTTILAYRLPLPHDTLVPAPYRHARDMVVISSLYGSADVPSISMETYQALVSRMQYRFSGLAFYRPVATRVPTAHRQTEELSVAFASRSLFELLGIPDIPPSVGRNGAALLLSEQTWRRSFDADSRIVGRTLQVAGTNAVISGIVPANWWRLPGRVDAWLLEDDRNLTLQLSQAKGFVLGHVRPQGMDSQRTWRWPIAVPNLQGYYDRLECMWLVPPGSTMPHVVIFFLALVILATTTSFTLGEYPPRPADTPVTRFRRWLFLGVKCALVVPIVFYGPLDLANFISPGIQPFTLFGYILGFRWALNDQRARCPVCLRLLTAPIRVGSASRVFLAWYGTELLCPKGHGRMHVPEIPTSSYSVQRWFQLDPSWRSLFS